VQAATRPMRVAEVCAELLELGHAPKSESVRKALHDRSRGEAPRLKGIGWGLYAQVAKQTGAEGGTLRPVHAERLQQQL
jgi:hypothetical protein